MNNAPEGEAQIREVDIPLVAALTHIFSIEFARPL